MKDFSHLPDLAGRTLINSDGDTVDLDVARSDITYVYSSNMYIAFSESIYYNAIRLKDTSIQRGTRKTKTPEVCQTSGVFYSVFVAA